MAGIPDPGPERAPAPETVARDLAAIEERLKTAQAELDQVTKERREALERLGRLHAERLADDGDGEGDEPTGDLGTPD